MIIRLLLIGFLISTTLLSAQHSLLEKAHFHDDHVEYLSEIDFDYHKSLSSLRSANPMIDFTFPDGTQEIITLKECSPFHPDLQARYPEIRSYKSAQNNGATLRISISHKGFYATAMQDGHTFIYENDITKGITNKLTISRRGDVEKSHQFKCLTEHAKHTDQHNLNRSTHGECELRMYRLAIACTGEYADFHGGTVDDVLAEYNIAFTRINGIFENELSITFEIIPNTDEIIFLNADLDPYTNNDAVAMLTQNQNTIDQLIGSANYDIGHVFSTGGGGIARINAVCGNAKARGVTGLPVPEGDVFYVDFVSHEIGHQFGARHSYNNDCDSNINPGTAYEPGSGSTIMSYAGICEPNVQNNTDAFFHNSSLVSIGEFVANGNGGQCGEIISSSNDGPQFDILPFDDQELLLPVRTPFILDANILDNGGDMTTFGWEQLDNDIAPMPPDSEVPIGPAFRSFFPTTSALRTFPNLGPILFNSNNSTWEVLPDNPREMTFSVSARRINADYGCTDSELMNVRFVDAGPLVVFNPNQSGEVWEVGTEQGVTWFVNGTDSGELNEENVTILLSLDGGLSYPEIIAGSTPNDGDHTFTVPNVASDACRILIIAENNLFFDINSVDFTIEKGFFASAEIDNQNLCFGDENSLIVVSVEGGQQPYEYSIDGENFQTSNVFSDLVGDIYTVTVKDANGITFEIANIEVEGHPELMVDLEFMQDNLIINASGGTGTLMYSLNGSDFTTTNQFTLVDGTTYAIDVIDENGCDRSLPPFIFYYISGTEVSLTPVDCTGNSTGSVVVDGVNGGLAPYEYGINSEFQESPIFTGLLADDYEIAVRDQAGNLFVSTATVLEADELLEIGVDVVEDEITINATNGQAPYEYSIDGTAFGASNVFSDLEDGAYECFVRDAYGCLVSVEQIIVSTSTLEFFDELSIYPNPTKDIINIDFYGAGAIDFQLNDLSGKTIRSGSFIDRTFIDISSFPSGNYILTLRKEGQLTECKINKL